ncbi:MAG: hypothetical protein N2039_12205 [Gemmataceae bacterium]|nr:hypothetical protein [Gemmataceae bacterium]
MSGGRLALLLWGLSALPLGATPPAGSMPLGGGPRPVGFHTPRAFVAGQRIAQPTFGECGSCGVSTEREPYRPCLHRLIDFLCYRPRGSCWVGLEPSEYTPPLWSWFPGGVCHARQGCDGCSANCDAAAGCAQCGGAVGQTSKKTGSASGQPMLVGGQNARINPWTLRTFAAEQSNKSKTIEPTPLSTYQASTYQMSTHQKPSPGDSGLLPSGYTVPSMKNLPMLRRYQPSDSGEAGAPTRPLPTMFPRR